MAKKENCSIPPELQRKLEVARTLFINSTWAKHFLYRELFRDWFPAEFTRAAGLVLPDNPTAKQRAIFNAAHAKIGTGDEPKELLPVWKRADEQWERTFPPLKALDIDPATWEAAGAAAGVSREELSTMKYQELAEVIFAWAHGKLANRQLSKVDSAAPDVRLSPAEQDIVSVIRKAGHRLTQREIFDALSEQGKLPSEGTTKITLAALVRHSILTHDAKADPPGYGLPEWEH